MLFAFYTAKAASGSSMVTYRREKTGATIHQGQTFRAKIERNRGEKGNQYSDSAEICAKLHGNYFRAVSWGAYHARQEKDLGRAHKAMILLEAIMGVLSTGVTKYGWIGSPVHAHKKINLPTNQKGCDKSETTYEKLSARRIQICGDYFCMNHVHLFLE